jgi:protein SCO1/2
MSRAFPFVPFLILAAAIAGLCTLGLTDTLTAAVTAEGVRAIRSSYPSGSLYALDAEVESAGGIRTPLAALGGGPRIATMFYAHCASMCPIALRTLQQLDASLSANERRRLRFLMLSLDPARDSPQALEAHAGAAHLDPDRWMVGRTSVEAVPLVAERLGVRYRALANGELDHASELILLDAKGRAVARTNGLGIVDESFIAALRALLAEGSPL